MQIKDLIEKTEPSDLDVFPIQETTGITKKITRANFLKNIVGSSSTNIGYDFRFLGDKNGVIYALGTAMYTTAFSNPANNSTIITTSSSVQSGHTFSKAFGRNPTVSHTSNGGSQWMEVDFLSRLIKPRYYLIQGRNDFNGHHPRNWKLQGSNNDSTWIDLDTQLNNATITQNTWFYGDVREVNQFYRYVRILQTGANSSGDTFLTLGQIEFYGDLQ
jgi:hypothetical protein